MMVDRSARDPGHEPPFLKWWGEDPPGDKPGKKYPLTSNRCQKAKRDGIF